MRRQLLLMRHAKSSWDDTSLADHDRPLARRGVEALPRMRDHLERSEYPPDVVLCSTARRAVDTLDGVRAAIPPHARVLLREELYGATADSLLVLLHGIDADTKCTMVVAHNPTLQDLALLLVGSGRTDIRQQLMTKLPTGAVVTLTFNDTWADLDTGTAALEDLFTPRPPRP